MTSTVHRRLLAGSLMAATLVLLAGCTGTPRNSDVDAARPGVTVYGTVDAGVSWTDK